MITWKTQDEVTLRKAVLTIGDARLRERLLEDCTSTLDAKTLLEANDSAVVRMAAHKAGYDECITNLLRLALTPTPQPIDSGHRAM